MVLHICNCSTYYNVLQNFMNDQINSLEKTHCQNRAKRIDNYLQILRPLYMKKKFRRASSRKNKLQRILFWEKKIFKHFLTGFDKGKQSHLHGKKFERPLCLWGKKKLDKPSTGKKICRGYRKEIFSSAPPSSLMVDPYLHSVPLGVYFTHCICSPCLYSSTVCCVTSIAPSTESSTVSQIYNIAPSHPAAITRWQNRGSNDADL